MKTCLCIYHFLVLNWYIFLNYYIPQHGKDQKQHKIFQDGAQWKYLTLLNLVSLHGHTRDQCMCNVSPSPRISFGFY